MRLLIAFAALSSCGSAPTKPAPPGYWEAMFCLRPSYQHLPRCNAEKVQPGTSPASGEVGVMDNTHHGRVVQEGQAVAGCSSASRDKMLAELYHYAVVYAQDGPVKLQTRFGKSCWKDEA